MPHDFGDIHDCTCNNLRKAARAVTQYYDEVLRPSRIRATRNLKLLEDEGLVTIAPGADARVREVSLTPVAQEKLAVAIRYWRRAQAEIASRMRTEGVRHLLRSLSGAVEAVRSE